jgi:hypothetical protein
MLVPTGALPSNIGITVKLSGSAIEYLPAFVFPVNARPAPMTVDYYDLELRGDRPLDEVKCTLSGSKSGRPFETTRTLTGMRPGSLSFLVKLDARPFDDGPLIATIDGFSRGKSISGIEIRTFRGCSSIEGNRRFVERY